MYSYSFLEWLMFFYFYCFVGWCIESTIVSIAEKHFVNRGFLRSPFLPLYGFGAIAMLLSTLFVKNNLILVYIFGMLTATVLEYITGALMESILKMKYWDYSLQKFNYKGRICLTSSLFWGVLALFLTEFLHEKVSYFIDLFKSRVPTMFVLTVIIISVLLSFDAYYSFKAAFDVNILLGKITVLKQQIAEYQEELKITTVEKKDAVKLKINELITENIILYQKFTTFKKWIIKAHPYAKSNQFNEALVEVRNKISEKRRNKNK